MSRLVGPSTLAEIHVGDVPCHALVDSGSQITTISHGFYLEHLSSLLLQPVDFLQIKGADDHRVPYLGYIAVDITLPDDDHGSSQTHTTLALVVPDTVFHQQAPVLLGTNLLHLCYTTCIERYGPSWTEWPVSSTWKQAYNCFAMVGNIVEKAVFNTKPHHIEANSRKVIVGRVETSILPHLVTVVTDGDGVSLPAGLVMSCSIDELHPGQTVHDVYVHLLNISTKDIVIPANAQLCNLKPVSCLQTPELLDNDEDVKEFLQRFNLDSLKDELPEHTIKQLECLLVRWKVIFSTGDHDLGRTDLVKHTFNLTDEIPVKQRSRRIPPGMLQEVKQHLSDMLRSGVIRESWSPWSSPLVIARKHDNSMRLCIDLREVNRRTKKDAYYLPRIPETLDALSGSKFFSSLDLQSGFWQIEIEEAHKERTAFSAAPLGFYEYCRLPFGATNGPSIFQRLIEKCVGGLQPGECLAYMDDLVIHAVTVEENLVRLEHVFERLHKAGLKLKPSKCNFLRRRMRFLGHVISENGVEADPDKVEALRSWPVPQNVKHLQTFLGFTGFYRRFVRNYSKIAEPLHCLIRGSNCRKKNNKNKRTRQQEAAAWCWDVPQHTSFETLVRILTSSEVLAYANYSLDFILHTDASGIGLGAVLCQIQDEKERPIAYASRTDEF